MLRTRDATKESAPRDNHNEAEVRDEVEKQSGRKSITGQHISFYRTSPISDSSHASTQHGIPICILPAAVSSVTPLGAISAAIESAHSVEARSTPPVPLHILGGVKSIAREGPS